MRRKSLIVVVDKKSEKGNTDKNFAHEEQNFADLQSATAENNSDKKTNNKIIKPIVSTGIRTGRSSSSRSGSGSRSGSSSRSGSTSRSDSSSESESRQNSGSGKKPIVGLGYRSGRSRSGTSSSSKSKSESLSRYKTGSLYREEKKPIVGTKLRSGKSSTKTSKKANRNVFSKISSKLGFSSRKKVSSAWILASTILIVVLTVQLAFVADTMNRYRSVFFEYDTISSEIKALNDPLTVKKDEYIDNYISNLLNKTLSATELATIARKYWKYEMKINGSIITDSFVEYVPNGLKIELFEREKERVFPAKIHLSGALSGGKANDVLSSHISFVPDDGFTIKNENYNETDPVTGEKYKVTKVTYTFTSTSVRNEDRVEIKVEPELAQRLK